MKKIKIIHAILLICIICSISYSCKNKIPDHFISFSYPDFQKEKKITGEKIILQGITDSRQMTHYKQFVICEEIKSDQLLSVFNIDTREKEFGFLPKGRGPGELLDVTDMEINPDRHELLVFDVITHRYNVYQLDSLLIKRKRQPEFSGEISANPYGDQLIRVNDTTYLGTGVASRVNFYDAKGNITGKAGNYDLFNNNEKDIWLTQIYKGHLRYNYSNGKIVFLNKLTDVIEFYDNNILEKVIQGPAHFDAVYKIVSINGGYAMAMVRKKTHIAYDLTWSDDDYIFALYSGNLSDEKGFRHFTNILTFSWEGKPLEHYILDIPVFAISVDIEKRIIYGLNDENQQPFLVKYKF
jgi:hypothetical protein